MSRSARGHKPSLRRSGSLLLFFPQGHVQRRMVAWSRRNLSGGQRDDRTLTTRTTCVRTLLTSADITQRPERTATRGRARAACSALASFQPGCTNCCHRCVWDDGEHGHDRLVADGEAVLDRLKNLVDQ